MAHGEFLRLLQLVDASRKATGRDSMEIRDADVATADEIDNRASSHRVQSEGREHDGLQCPECQHIRSEDALLREKLFSQGQDFPMDVWQDG